jgi:hypothetical protein
MRNGGWVNSDMTSHVFVSYSHEDERVVKPIIKLYRSTGAAIFIDRMDIPLGAQWRAAVYGAIDTCSAVWVFWCRHASGSEEVKSEYMRGIQRGKVTLPILLDPTPVSPPLATFQWLDMQGAFKAHEYETYATMSLAEARRIQRADRKNTSFDITGEREDLDDEFPLEMAFSDGNLYREGWEFAGDKLIRRNRVVSTPTESQLQAAISKLKEHFTAFQH